MFAVVHDGWKLVQHTHRAGAPEAQESIGLDELERLRSLGYIK